MPGFPRVLLALAGLVVTFVLFTNFSDGRLSVFDPFDYGQRIVEVDSLATDESFVATHPNHLGYNLALFAVNGALESAGVAESGHTATRVLGALGASLSLLAVAMFSGRRQPLLGVLCALPLFASRGFLVDAAAGESVPIATAFGLFALFCASREVVPKWSLGAWVFLAVTTRQDGLWFVPGVLLLAAPRIGTWSAIRILGLAGLASALVYLGVWRIQPGDTGLVDYLLGLGQRGDWSLGPTLGLSAPRLMFDALHAALFGRQQAFGEVPLWPALLVLSALGLVFACLRSDRVPRGLPLAIAAVLVCRIAFFLYFEPNNWEWQVPNFALLCALAAGAGAEIDSLRLPRVRLAGLVCVLLTASLLVVHARDTVQLRRTRLRDAVDSALVIAGPDAAVFHLDHRVERLLVSAGRVPNRLQVPETHRGSPVPLDLEQHFELFGTAAPLSPIPVVLIADCFVRDGQPHTRRGLATLLEDRDLTSPAEPIRVLGFDGIAYAWLKR